jgi:hypothetical protein
MDRGREFVQTVKTPKTMSKEQVAKNKGKRRKPGFVLPSRLCVRFFFEN